MSTPYRPLPKEVSFPQLEEEVLARWRERDIFKESLRRREGAPRWVFYEGPPTANGSPGSHHVLSRTFKDIFPRYKTMQGHYVPRKGGWDCHGLPVEIAVEQKLGFKSKEDIEAYGIAEFNQKCREAVFEYLDDWDALTERIGFWVDLEGAYRTLDTSYIESVWWVLKTLWDKGLLIERYKVVPYCVRCGTALSSHEVAQGYQDVEDPSVIVRFPVRDAKGPVQGDDVLLVWTTTPWTLVSNAAVAVHPELTYVRARAGGDNEAGANQDATFVVAEPLVERILGEGAEILDRFTGSDLEGVSYEPPFPYLTAADYGEKGHTVLPAEFVSAQDGTGLVHTAIAFGEDDFQLGQQYGLEVINPVRPDGTYDQRIGAYAGRWVKDADPDLIADLKSRGRVFKSETFIHSYPHCWRCSTPLIYYSKPSWYVATSTLRDRLLNSNEGVNWYPPHIKHGRFGKWLENNVDWAISRERYWGTPLPIWQCKNGHRECVGSFEELKAHTGVDLPDPHRPYVDEQQWKCSECDEEMHRVPEVIDVWFDTGCMPFAQFHSPFENQEEFERSFPADFICEAIDQTRGWFYSLLAVSTLLFDRSSYETVLCLGHIADSQGRKMSKSLGNIVNPWDVINKHGADAFRWYYLASKQPWDGYLFSSKTIGESVRQFLLQLWNTYGFFVLYANVNNVEGESASFFDTLPGDGDLKDKGYTELDRWLISRLHATVEGVTERLEDFDTTTAGREISEFIDEVSNWYVRRSRRRFWDGDPAAFAVLRHCLVTTAKLAAPFIPFVTDEIYDNLDGSESSVHLCDYPKVGARDRELEDAMAVVRETVKLGLAARGQAKVKVRQPLRAAVIVAQGEERTAIEKLAHLVQDELNVKELRYVSQADELATYNVKPNYRSLGPRFGKQMPQVAAAVAALNPEHVAGTINNSGRVGINIEGRDHDLAAEDLLLVMEPIDGYQLEREGSHAVALELELDDSLRHEGWAREIVHAVQNTRKSAGLAVEDRIDLSLSGNPELLTAAQEYESYVTGETLAISIVYGENGSTQSEPSAVEQITIDSHKLTIALKRTPSK
jgi:isoleucyl-tRNA synthetase